MSRLALLAAVAVFLAFIGTLADGGSLRPTAVQAHTCGPAGYFVSSLPEVNVYTISAGGETTDYVVSSQPNPGVASITPQTIEGGTDGVFTVTIDGSQFPLLVTTTIEITWTVPEDNESGKCVIDIHITAPTPSPTPTPTPTGTPTPTPTATPKSIVKHGETYSEWQLGVGVAGILGGDALVANDLGDTPTASLLHQISIFKLGLGSIAGDAAALADEFDPDVLPPEPAARDGTAVVLGVNGAPAISDIQNFLTGESIESAPPGTPILLVGSGFGLGLTNDVVIDGQEVESVGLSETELMTGVPIPLAAAAPASGPFDPLPKDVEIIVTNDGGTSSAAPFTVSPLATPTGPPGSLLGPIFELELQLHEAMKTWDCTVIGNTKFVVEGRAQFIAACEEWLAGIPELLSALEELLELLPGLDAESLALIESMLTPVAGIQAVLEDELIPGFSDPDGDGLPNDWDNCDTIANPDQADADADVIGDACEFLSALVQGDVDCGGGVTAVDGLMGLRHVAGLGVTQEPGCYEIGSEVASIFGDVDCDDDVDATDSLKVLRFVAGLSFNQTEPCPDIGSDLGAGGSPGSALSRAATIVSVVMGLFVLVGVVRVSTRSRRR